MAEFKRIIIADGDHSMATLHMRNALNGLCLTHLKEKKASSEICEAIRELIFAKTAYLNQLNKILEESTTPELNIYKDQINNLNVDESLLLELHNSSLTFHIKSFIVFSKSILDKVVPLIKYRFPNFKHNNFDDRGRKLINFLKQKYTGTNKHEIIKLIEDAKTDWLDFTFRLRDDIIHNSNFSNYCNFHLTLNRNDAGSVSSIVDFKEPTLYDENREIYARDFVNDISDALIDLINQILTKLGFDKYHKLNFSNKCPHCNNEYVSLSEDNCKKEMLIKESTSFHLVSPENNHGVIGCPKCKKEFDMNLGAFYEHGLPTNF